MAYWYNTAVEAILDGTVVLTEANLDVALLSSSYTFDDAHDNMTNVSANEMSSSNYARTNLSSVVVTASGSGAYLDAANTVFSSLGSDAGSPGFAVIFVSGATDAASQLILTTPIDGTEAARLPDGNNYEIAWPAGGIGTWFSGSTNPFWYNSGVHAVMSGTTDFLATTVTALLLTSAYTFNAANSAPGDLTNELSGGGYARVTVSNKVVTLSDANNGAFFDVTADIQFPSLGAAAGTPAYMVFYDEDDATDQLLFMIELTTPATPNGNNYNVTPAAGGVATSYNA